MKEVDNSGYTDLDEDLSDMVYVTPRSLTLKKNKKKIIKEYFMESYKIPNNLIKNLELNIDTEKSDDCPYNFNINNFILKPSIDGKTLDFIFPKFDKFVWDEDLNRYNLHSNKSNFLILSKKGDTDYDYKGIYTMSNIDYNIKINRIDNINKLDNSNYLFHIENSKDKYQAQLKNGNLNIQFPYKNNLNKLGPFVLDNSYKVPIYRGKSSNLKDYHIYFKKLGNKFCGNFLGKKIYMEKQKNIYDFKYFFNILIFIISIYLFLIDQNKNLVKFFTSYFYPFFYTLYNILIFTK